MSSNLLARPKVVAHRGASHDAPENTLAAFSLAWEQGADAVECDVRVTRDDQLVCLHDGNTKRTTGKALSATNSTLAQLRELDAGSWKGAQWKNERIPTFTEVLSKAPSGKLVFAEVKGGVKVVPLLPKAIADAKIAEEQVVVISFDKDVIRAAKRTLKRSKAILLVNFKYSKLRQAWKPSMKTVISDMGKTGADGVDLHAIEPASAALIESVRLLDGDVHVWTVNDAETATRFQNLGVDSITTDKPKVIRELLEAHRTPRADTAQ